jgi:membrane-bound inhibitor of C-type lysozyme
MRLSNLLRSLPLLLALAACAPPPPAPQGASERYTCEGSESVQVHYGASEAVLVYQGRVFTLRASRAASGARYVTEQGRRSGYSLEWFTRGDEGLLVEAPLSDSRSMADVRTVMRCLRH